MEFIDGRIIESYPNSGGGGKGTGSGFHLDPYPPIEGQNLFSGSTLAEIIRKRDEVFTGGSIILDEYDKDPMRMVILSQHKADGTFEITYENRMADMWVNTFGHITDTINLGSHSFTELDDGYKLTSTVNKKYFPGKGINFSTVAPDPDPLHPDWLPWQNIDINTLLNSDALLDGIMATENEDKLTKDILYTFDKKQTGPDPKDTKLKINATPNFQVLDKKIISSKYNVDSTGYRNTDGSYSLDVNVVPKGIKNMMKGGKGIEIDFEEADPPSLTDGSIVISSTGELTEETITNASEEHPEFSIDHDPDEKTYKLGIGRIHGTNLTPSFTDKDGAQVVPENDRMPKPIVFPHTRVYDDGLESTYFVADDSQGGFSSAVYKTLKPVDSDVRSAMKYGEGISVTDTGAEGGEEYVTISLNKATAVKAVENAENLTGDVKTSITGSETNPKIKYEFRKDKLALAVKDVLEEGNNVTIVLDSASGQPKVKIGSSGGGGGGGDITAGQLQSLINQGGEIKSTVLGNAVSFTMDRSSLMNHLWVPSSAPDVSNPIFKDSPDIKFTQNSDTFYLNIKPTSTVLDDIKTKFKQGSTMLHVKELLQGPGILMVPEATDPTKLKIHSTANLVVKVEGSEDKHINKIHVEGDIDKTHTVLDDTLYLHGVKAVKKDGTEVGVMSGLKVKSGITLDKEMVGGKPTGNILIGGSRELNTQVDGVATNSVNKIFVPENSGEYADSNKTLKLAGVQGVAGGNTKHINKITVTNNATVNTSTVSGDGHLEINIPAPGGGGGTPSPSTIKVKGVGQPEFAASSMDFDAGFLVSQHSVGADTVAVIQNKGILATGPDSALRIDTNALKIDGGGVKLKAEGTGEVSRIAHYEIKTPVHGNKSGGEAVGDYFDRLTFDNKHFTVTPDTTTAAGLKIANIAFKHDVNSVDLGYFNSFSELKTAAKEVDIPFVKGRVFGHVRRSDTIATDVLIGHYLYEWNNANTDPNDTEIMKDSNWDRVLTPTGGSPIPMFGKNAVEDILKTWKPIVGSDNGYQAVKHRNQIVHWTKQDGDVSPYRTGYYYTDGTSWHSLSTGAQVGVTAYDVNSLQIGHTGNKISFGTHLVGVKKGASPNAYMEIDSRGLIVSKKGSGAGFTGIHGLRFDGAEVTQPTGLDGIADIKISGGTFPGMQYKHTSLAGVEKTFENIKSVHLTGGLVAEEGEGGISIKAILPQNIAFLGVYDTPTALLDCAKTLKIPFEKYKVSGMVRRNGKGESTRIVGYDLWHWNMDKTDPTQEEIGTDTNWTRTMLAALGQGVLHLGRNSIYPRWTPSDSTTYPAANAPGQIIWYTNDGSHQGHYFSDGTNWTKLSTGGGAGSHLTVSGFKEGETSESTIDNVTSIKFNGGFIKGTSGTNLELVSGISAEIKKSKTDPATPGTATHWQETIKTIEVNGDTSMFSYDQDNHALNMLLWNTADAADGTNMQADHPAASNPGRIGFTSGPEKSLYVVDRTETKWVKVGRKDLPEQHDALLKRFPETIVETSTYSEIKETGYVFVNRENVQKPVAAGGLGLTKGDQGVLLNLYTGDGKRWVQMFYEMTNNNVWSRSHGEGTGASSGTWNSWQQVSGIDDGCYSVMTIDNDKTAKDVSDADYKMPYMISQDPKANIIPTNEDGNFKVRRTGTYNINCIAQFTWEAKNIPAETPATTGAVMGIYEDGTERWKLEITENVYDAAKKEFHPLKGLFSNIPMTEGKTYHVVVALSSASGDEKTLLELDPFKNMISIDPANSDSKTGFRIMKNLYRSLGGISFATGNEVRTEKATDGKSIRVFGEEYLTTFKTLTATAIKKPR